MNMRSLFLGASVALIATAALATVTFDPVSGTGFVGKGDVQLAFGWNDAMLQSNATGVTFEYDVSRSYDVTIEFDTGNPEHNVTHHTVNQTSSTVINDTVARDLRLNSQQKVTGFNLTGNSTTTVTGDPLPHVGDSCPNGNLGTCVVTAVTPLGGTGGGLYVDYGGNKVLLLAM